MNHRTWTVANGAPADIWDMQQDDRGFMWLATGSGLFRFDGVQFEHYTPTPGESFSSSDMTALSVASNDELWVGTSDGVISHLKSGHITNYPISKVTREGPVFCIVTAPDGALWVAAGRELLRYSDGGFKAVGADWNYPADVQSMWMVVDRQGTLWLATDKELFFLRKGTRRFERTGIPTGMYAVLALSPDGTLWLSDGLHGTRALPGLSAGHIPSQLLQPLPDTNFAQSKRLAFDRDGSLWGTLWPGAGIDGVFRVVHPSRLADGQPLRPETVTDTYSTVQGLTSIVAVPVLADSEGGVWIGTNFGLNSFHANSFTVVSPNPKSSPATAWLSPDDAGRVFLMQDGCLYRVSHAIPALLTCEFPVHASELISAGDRVITEMAGVPYQWNTQTRAMPLQPLARPSQVHISAIARDAQGNLWAALSGGLHELVGDDWRHIDIGAALSNTQPNAIAFDAHDTAWLGYANGQVASWNGNVSVIYAEHDGLNVGDVEAISSQGNAVLVAGDAGVARWKHGRFQSIQAARVGVLSAVTGIAQTPTGDLWLNTSVGVVRIAAHEAERAFEQPDYIPGYELYGSEDGVPGIALRQPLASTITTDEDGRLWFATNQGVCWIAPSRIRFNVIAPQVLIESVLAEGEQYTISGHLVLPPHTTTISLQYAAASFRSPQNVKFRYKLSGIDSAWQDAGAHRQAIYANLGPGDYEFQVIAANSDGIWSEHPASLAFRIKRTFYQTRCFQILSILAAILCVVALIVFQYRRMVATVRDRLEVRHAERERIARELHDTLLQGIQGLLLYFHAVAERLPGEDPIRAQIDQALDRAEALLVDGRDRVRDMRASDRATSDLAVAFATLGEGLAAEWPATFRVVSIGTRLDIDPAIREEVYLIGREALLNAFHHAKAVEIEVEIAYDAKQLRVCVRDNGIGIKPEILEAGRRPGHWGLVGMRERANCISGQLRIWARPGTGTQIELVVPARIAYAHVRRSRWTWFKRLLSMGR
jgi:signal transduction histidine kinase/ligand-binding sensor domain-containing protein